MFRQRQISLAVMALVCRRYRRSPLLPNSNNRSRLQRVEITGSNIKRVDVETVAPVEIITREQIERSGQPTVADVLRNLPANTGGSFSESFSNSFAPGAAGISLRGLGQKTTLVLINGRRIAGYGFAQNLQDTFVDLNSIPTQRGRAHRDPEGRRLRDLRLRRHRRRGEHHPAQATSGASKPASPCG